MDCPAGGSKISAQVNCPSARQSIRSGALGDAAKQPVPTTSRIYLHFDGAVAIENERPMRSEFRAEIGKVCVAYLGGEALLKTMVDLADHRTAAQARGLVRAGTLDGQAPLRLYLSLLRGPAALDSRQKCTDKSLGLRTC